MRAFAMAGRFWYLVASALGMSACSESDAGSPRLAQAGGAAAAGASTTAGVAGASAGATTGGVSLSGASSVGGAFGGSASGGSANGASAGGGMGGTEPGGGAGQAGAGGTPPKTFLLPAFSGSAAKPSANLGTRNAGHEFAVTGEGVVVRELGVWDNGADGLAAPHVVTLFSLATKVTPAT